MAQSGHPYVVSTGTGSGKSLTYLLPIVDSVFRGNPVDRSVRALVIYPMNALINNHGASLPMRRAPFAAPAEQTLAAVKEAGARDAADRLVQAEAERLLARLRPSSRGYPIESIQQLAQLPGIAHTAHDPPPQIRPDPPGEDFAGGMKPALE